MQTYKRHAIFWLTIYVLWTIMRGGGEDYPKYLILNLFNVPIYMMAYYVLRYIQIPLLYNRDKLGWFLFSFIPFSILFYLIWRFLGTIYVDNLLGREGKIPWFSTGYFFMETVQTYAPGMALFAWESHHQRLKEMDRIHQLEKDKISTELKFLKAQVNPNLLFNTLKSLHEKVIDKSPNAPDMILRLSAILDYVLYKSQNKTVQLGEELETIENYIALEEHRHGEKLQVEYDVHADQSILISPLILLSLVENIFKPISENSKVLTKIKIVIREKEGSIHSEAWTTQDLHSTKKQEIELDDFSNIKRQLNLVYPDMHTITKQEKENSIGILLTINQKQWA